MARGRTWDEATIERAVRAPSSGLGPVLGEGSWAAAAAAVEPIVSEARADRGAPWPWPSARAYARFWRDGDRTEYETAVFARQRRLNAAVVAALITGEDGWLDEVADGVIGLCEQSTWCWPAHDEAWSVHGAWTPQVLAPSVDLGAGEAAAQLAWIDASLGQALEERYPGLGARVRLEYRRRIVEPLLARTDWWWLDPARIINWTPWILGNVVMGAVQLSEPAERAEQLRIAIGGVDLFLQSLPDDGAVDEGYSYWWAGVARALDAIEVLERVTGVIAASDVKGLAELVRFPTSMHLSSGWVVSHADGVARPDELPWRILRHWGGVVGDDASVALAASHRAEGVTGAMQSTGRVLMALRDQSWVAAEAGRVPSPADVWLPSVQVRVVRPRAAAGLTLVVKGGHNDESHNHNDVGAVSIAVGGRPVAVDAGREEYTAQTFSDDRYGLWFTQSGWHNVPVLEGREQPAGAQFGAGEVEVLDGDRRGLSVELAGAYPAGVVTSATRIATLEEDGAVVVTDGWAWPGEARDAVVHWVVCGEPVAYGERRLVIELPDVAPVALTWEGAAPLAEIETRELTDGRMVRAWGPRLWRVALHATGPTVTSRWQAE